jgi:hypothetical protein
MAADALHRRSTYNAGSTGPGSATPHAPPAAVTAAGPAERGECGIGESVECRAAKTEL